jgi:hypothetical protein
MTIWPVNDATARLSDPLNATVTIGPQVFEHHGKQAVAMLPVEQRERLKRLEAVDIKDWLLHQGPKLDAGLPLPSRSSPNFKVRNTR